MSSFFLAQIGVYTDASVVKTAIILRGMERTNAIPEILLLWRLTQKLRNRVSGRRRGVKIVNSTGGFWHG